MAKTVHHLVACMHRDARPLTRGVSRQGCGLHIDTAGIATSQFEYLWIHHPVPEKWHIGQQEHTKIAAGQLGNIIVVPQGLVAAGSEGVMIRVAFKMKCNQV